MFGITSVRQKIVTLVLFKIKSQKSEARVYYMVKRVSAYGGCLGSWRR